MNIYVGNLSFSATNEELQKMFSEFGTVASASVIQDKLSGRSRGFGFVEMPNDEEGKAAIAAMNGKDVGGRKLTVNEARPRTEGGPRRESRPRGAFQKSAWGSDRG
jgi:RNA recognition motif-containing protein